MSNATYVWRTAQGLCGQCGRPPEEGWRTCAPCRRKQRRRDRERYYRYQATGLCVRCGQAPPRAGYGTCAGCYTPHPKAVRHGL